MSAATVVLAAHISGSVIALDFDGTLAPIVADPQQSRPVPGVVETLATLARAGAQIAIVTGRDALTVLELGQLQVIPGLVISGLHGAEVWRDGTLTTRAEPPGIAVLREQIPPLLHDVADDAWLEDKRLSLVVHTRRAADPDRAWASLHPVVTELAEMQGLEVHPGKQVLEIRIPHLSKADAVAELLSEQTSAALFAGDDVGDLPAVRVVNEWGAQTGRPTLTVAVGEVAELQEITDITVETPQDLAALLATLLA
jgi:trehalose 6-phosphate phosphatase